MGGLVERLLRANAEVLRRWLARWVPGPARAGVMTFRSNEGGWIGMGEITVPSDSAPLTASVTFLDSEGNQTEPEDTPQWSSTDESVATVTAQADGMTAEVAIGSPGAAVIEVKATDPDDGSEAVAQGTVTVQPGEAVIGEVTFSGPGA